jgi:hypothetical protein
MVRLDSITAAVEAMRMVVVVGMRAKEENVTYPAFLIASMIMVRASSLS